MIDRIVPSQAIIGGINWGLWAFQFDLVAFLFGGVIADTKQDHLRFGSYFGYLVHFTVF